jgi:hypothetical protein
MYCNTLICTSPLIDDPNGSGLTVTDPLIASSRTLAEIVVLIGTPSLLKKEEEKKQKKINIIVKSRFHI